MAFRGQQINDANLLVNAIRTAEGSGTIGPGSANLLMHNARLAIAARMDVEQEITLLGIRYVCKEASERYTLIPKV